MQAYRKISKGVIRIGTSGIVLPGTKQSFPEEFQSGSRLQYYSVLFNTLEVNSTFYNLPRASTFKRWSTEVSDGFQFTIKLWRNITHAKKLLYNFNDIDIFMLAARHLDNKKGCLLIQFPASITFQYVNEVERIIQHVNQTNTDEPWKICVEFRHASWYNDSTYDMLNYYKCSLVLHDMAVSKPYITNAALHTVYLRFHGPQGDYKGSYTDDFLKDYAEKITEWAHQGKDVYIYFNNTIGSAFQNARLLQKLVL